MIMCNDVHTVRVSVLDTWEFLVLLDDEAKAQKFISVKCVNCMQIHRKTCKMRTFQVKFIRFRRCTTKICFFEVK